MKYRAVNNSRLYEALQPYRYKKDIPDNQRRLEPLEIDFGLYGVGYVPRNESGALLTRSGEWMPCHTAHLVTPGAVVGPRDLEAAAGKPWADEWRQSYADAIAERIGLSS